MQLNNLFLVNERQPVNITVYGERIKAVRPADNPEEAEPFQIQFSGATAIPGLINSHDHLDFNCFPVYGEKIYNNYTEWGKSIHENYKDHISAIMNIPQNLRSREC